MSGSSSFAKQKVAYSQHIKTQHDIQNVNGVLVLLSILEYRLRPYSRHPLFPILYDRSGQLDELQKPQLMRQFFPFLMTPYF